MRWVVVTLLALHGPIHLMGLRRHFDYASLPQLTQPISRGMGLLWLTAGAALMVGSAVMKVSGLAVSPTVACA